MTDEPKKPTIEEARADPERYTVGVNNSIYDKQAGRIVAKYPSDGRYDITKENAAEMRQKGKDAVLLAQLRGLAASRGHPLPDDITLGEIVSGASSAVEALTTHMASTFLNSKNLRGMGETYGRLVNPLTGETERGGAQAVFVSNTNISDGATARKMLEILGEVKAVQQRGEVIDAEVRDVPKGE